MVVIAGLGGMGAAKGGEHRAQHLLGRGLADRTGDGHDARIGTCTGGAAQRFQPLQHVLHDQKRRVLIQPLGDARDQRGGGTFFQRLCDEIMPVPRRLERHKEIAGLQRAGVDGNAGGGPVCCGAAARGGGGLGGSPQSHGMAPSSAETATLACSASSKG